MASYVPNTKEERLEMLKEIGLSSFDDLYRDVPAEVALDRPLDLPAGMSELAVRRVVSGMAAKNKVFPTIFRGAGAYRHYIPSMVTNVLSKENLQTAYTPYQAEISQGILQSIFEYQTHICELTGMDVSNASVYDGAEAAAEAVSMCYGRKRKKAIVCGTANPYTISTIQTYTFGNEYELVIIPEKDGVTDMDALKAALDKETASVFLQHPNYFGNLEDAAAIGEAAHEVGAKFIMGVNPISLGVVKTPREYGADVACGDAQPLGLSIGFGGPYVGFMASTKEMMRSLPGRIVGQTHDDDGRIGYVLTLQAREQHIRREKASSNICSNQALCALAVGVYLSTVGKDGFVEVSCQSLSKAHYMADALAAAGLTVENKGAYFNEFVTRGGDAAKILAKLEENDILGGLPLGDDRILWCCTEVNTKEEIDECVRLVKEVL